MRVYTQRLELVILDWLFTHLLIFLNLILKSGFVWFTQSFANQALHFFSVTVAIERKLTNLFTDISPPLVLLGSILGSGDEGFAEWSKT